MEHVTRMPKQQNKFRLTDLKVQALVSKKPTTGRADYYDEGLPAFGLLVSSTGIASWFIWYRVAGKLTREVLGRYPQRSLADARTLAKDRLDLLDEGKDPRLEDAKRAALEAKHSSETIGRLALDYRREHLSAKRSGDRQWRELEADILPFWKSLPARDLTRAMIATRLDAVKAKRGHVSRNRRLALVRGMLNFALDRELISANPAARLKLLEETSRERILSDDELVEVWRASEKLESPQRQAVQFLILTGQRRNECFRAELAEVDRRQGIWVIGGARMKAKRPHLVPLVPAMCAVLDSLPAARKGQVHVFASPHRRSAAVPFGDHGGLKELLDKHVLEARHERDPDAEPMTPWTFHDVRRTMRTTMSRLRVDSEVAERCIAHVPGGIRAVYDVWEFIDARKEAFGKWAAFLDSLLSLPAGNVVRLER